MLRVIKSTNLNLGYEPEPVAIDNTVVIKQKEIPAEPESEGDNIFREFVAEDVTDVVFEPSETPQEIALRELSEKEELLNQKEAELSEKEQFINSEYERLMKEAEEKSKALFEETIKNAEADAEIIRKTAAEKGYSEGNEKSKATAEKYLSAAAELVSQATAQKEAYYISHKDELIETACFLAEKLIATKLSEDKSVIANIAANAAKDFRNSERVKISLASADISAEATADIDYLKSLIKGIPDIEIEILENAKTGTVVLDNGSEIIDASVPTQLDFLKEIMENSRIRKTED
ncbi:MAG: hypothetical protein IJ330_00135 [Oscillospiraceae bacterium]|nr:hypothetical protein [Oscillospiraceae bacterium]